MKTCFLCPSFIANTYLNLVGGCSHEATWPGRELISILPRFHLLGQTNGIYSRLSLSRTRKGPVNFFEMEKVRDREKVLKIRKQMTKDEIIRFSVILGIPLNKISENNLLCQLALSKSIFLLLINQQT